MFVLCLRSVGRFVYWWGEGVWGIADECGFIWICTCCPFIIIGLPLMIVTGILAPIGVCCASILCGPTAAVTAYNKGIKASFVYMVEAIVEANQQYAKFVIDGDLPEKFFFWCEW